MQNPDLKAYPASIYRCLALLLTATLALAACGGGGSDDGAPTYAVGGSVTGLIAGERVVMQENGGNNTPVSVNASFSFNTRLATGADYAVTVLTQPTGEICTVRNGSGTVGAANISVAVTCVPNSYTVGGTVVGLVPGNNIVLADNGGNSISVSANTSFTFATALLSGSAYAVTVSTQPTGQSCSVTNGSGTLSGANISNVSVSCATLSYNVGVTVFGLLANTSIVLQDNGGDTLTVSNTGAFTFKTQLQYGTAYAVTVATQPASQTCYAPSNGSGSVGAADVSVTIVCPWHVMYAANFAGGSIVAYYIDPTSGGLLAFPNSGAAASGLTFPMNIAVTPNQKYLYVSESADPGFIAGFAINPTTGALTSIAGSPFAAGTAPRSVTIDSSGGFLYAANISIYCDNSFCGYPPTSISAYRINAETGGLRFDALGR